MFFDIRAGELDYKKEIGESIDKFGKKPQMLLSNEISGKIALALLGGGFKPKQDSAAIWADHFTYLFHMGADLEDFPASQISLAEGKFLDNRSPQDLLREYLWGQMVWNLLNAVGSLSKGQLKALAEDEAKQKQVKDRTEIISYLETIGITLFNAILATKSNQVLDEKKKIVNILFGDFNSNPGAGKTNPALKRPFMGQTTLKKWLNPDEENWNVLRTGDANTAEGEPLRMVIDWLEKITSIACKIYQSQGDPPTDYQGTKSNYYTNGEGQSKFIADVWDAIFNDISKFEFESDNEVTEDQEVLVEDKEAEYIVMILKTICTHQQKGLDAICASETLGIKLKWPHWDEQKKNEIRKLASNFEVTLPDWMIDPKSN